MKTKPTSLRFLLPFVALLAGCSQPSQMNGLWELPSTDVSLFRSTETDTLRQIQPHLSKAKDQDRHILLYFTGSDWCPPCQKLHSEVFATPSFRAYARETFIPVMVDFPRRLPMSDEQKAANMMLAEELGIRSLPTVVVIDRSGRIVGRTGYRPGGAEPFIRHLEGIVRSR